MRSDLRLRGADGFDLPFLERVFVLAADWDPATARGEEHWMSDPSLERYLGSWRDRRDFGFVVEAGSEPIAAVWARYFEAGDGSYGFVDESTPELTIGVLPQYRGRAWGACSCKRRRRLLPRG